MCGIDLKVNKRKINKNLRKQQAIMWAKLKNTGITYGVNRIDAGMYYCPYNPLLQEVFTNLKYV